MSLLPGDSLEVSVLFSPETVQIYSDMVTVFGRPYIILQARFHLWEALLMSSQTLLLMEPVTIVWPTISFHLPGWFFKTLNLDIVNIGTPDPEIEEIILEEIRSFPLTSTRPFSLSTALHVCSV